MKRAKTPTFLLELPLRVDAGQANRLRAHLESARCLYNALVGEALGRLHRMQIDPAWQAARAIPRSHNQERQAAFSRLRKQYGFSDYALHDYAKGARCTWISSHIDSTMAQTLATRAYQAVNRVCLGQAKKVRFKSKGRGLDSVEGKRNDTGMRFLFQVTEERNEGCLLWGEDRIPALIDWDDPVIQHGLRQCIKYVRLVRRKASSPQAQGADSAGNRYFVQLILEGKPYLKKPLPERWHHCACGIGPVQRDLYSAFLLAYLEPAEITPSIAQEDWEGAEPRLVAAMEVLQQRAKEGQRLPRSSGITGARARRPKSLALIRQELVYLCRRGRLEALGMEQEPSCLLAGEVQMSTITLEGSAVLPVDNHRQNIPLGGL